VFTEFPDRAQRLFFFALHKQQKLLMRKNACNGARNGHLIFKAEASYSLAKRTTKREGDA
jgi:hypothetical protein